MKVLNLQKVSRIKFTGSKMRLDGGIGFQVLGKLSKLSSFCCPKQKGITRKLQRLGKLWDI